MLRQSDSGGEGGPVKQGPPQQGGKGGGKAAPAKAGQPVPDAGWKEVVRKSKKVSVPSNAISRVIGRGGSNINAIRELSGAHIEVEKQSKGQGDRTILIKGSAEATRLANTWISAIIASPDKDLADIVGRQQYKTLSTVKASQATLVVTKTQLVKTVVTTTQGGLQKSKSADMKSKAGQATVTAVTATTTRMIVTQTGASLTTKTKPVTSTSFAAIAAGQDNFGMIPTGPPPASALKAAPGKTGAKEKEQQGGRRKEAEAPTASVPPPLMPPTSSQTSDSKDYSPFKTFKMPGGGFVNWGAEASGGGSKESNQQQQSGGFKGFISHPASVSAPGSEDQSKAPGFRQGGSSPSSSSNTWVAASSSVTSLAPGYKGNKAGLVTTVMTTTTTTKEIVVTSSSSSLFPVQERCNSAPGTPISPLATPSPIAPPSSSAISKPATTSPGSEPDWFARPPGAGTMGLRSMTPDGDLDRGWGGLRDDLGVHSQGARQGTGSYGHNSPAKAPGAPLPDLFGRSKMQEPSLAEQNLLSAAAQLSNLGQGGYSDLLTSTATPIPLPGEGSAPSSSTGFPGFGRFGLGQQQPRFTSPGVPNTTGLVFSQPPNMSVPSAGLPKGLNPNAPDFNRGGMYSQMRGNMARAQGMPPQQKIPNSGFGYNNFGMNSSFAPPPQQANSQNILINQGINAYLSSLSAGASHGPMGDMGMSGLAGLAEMSLGGRTLSELTDMLGPEAVPGYNPSSMGNINDELSSLSGIRSSAGPIGRPIGAERQRMGPSPLGAGMGPQARKVDPFGVWDLPPSYSDNMGGSNLGAPEANFSLLPPSLSGQTLQSALDNLSKGSFSDLHYNGGAPGGALDPGSIGGQTPGSGFGLSPASLTPSKPDYSDWGTGSTSGSAPPSGQKLHGGDPFRGDPAAVRRNMVSQLFNLLPIPSTCIHLILLLSEPDVAKGVGGLCLAPPNSRGTSLNCAVPLRPV